MITLNDAIERSRLAADETGMLSQVTYNLILDNLSDSEKYPFTLALVDLGIQTRRGSLETTKIISKVLGKVNKVNKNNAIDLNNPEYWLT